MIDYEIGFAVNRFDGKCRVCKSALFFNAGHSLLASGINPCSYEYVLEIISNLEKIISGEMLEFEWGGGERTWFVSSKESTMALDNFGWSNSIELQTSTMIKILESKKNLSENWVKGDILLLLGKAFDLICQDFNRFIEDKDGCLYKFKEEDTNLVVKLILLEEDLTIKQETYLEQVCITNL